MGFQAKTLCESVMKTMMGSPRMAGWLCFHAAPTRKETINDFAPWKLILIRLWAGLMWQQVLKLSFTHFLVLLQKISHFFD
jgi:hypothetical protein